MTLIPKQIVASVHRSDLNPRQVEREFTGLVKNGAKIQVAGANRKTPGKLLDGLLPKHKIELFDTRFYLTNIRQIPELRFYVGYIVQGNQRRQSYNVYPRIIYKDLSLVWRSASHFSIDEGDIWIGKGDVRITIQGEHRVVESIEATTDLPLEIQTALESLLTWSRRAAGGAGILNRVLRQGPDHRVQPYRDFTAPRELARADRRNLINRGRSIARFARKLDPTSLSIVKGFEPDFSKGVVETSQSRSKLYGGTLRRFRILSTNRKIQYLFMAGAKHVWIIPPQATTTMLSSYGVRTIDVVADDDLFIPGYEYHHYDETENGRELYSQIPPGFAGETCPVDDAKADASPWLDKIPLIQKFRRHLL